MPCRAGRLGLAKAPIGPTRKGISGMQLSHTPGATAAVFDDPNLVSSAGLVPVLALALAESADLRGLADAHLSVPTDKGANAGLKVASLIGGMVAGADCIDDMALLRHGGMGRLFGGVYAPPRRWGHSCARSRSGMCVSSTRWLRLLRGPRVERAAGHGHHSGGSAPLVVAQRLRKGSGGSPRGAKRLVAD